MIIPNPSIHREIGWGWISQCCNPKVMARSSQCHGKVKSTQKRWKKLFWVFFLQLCSLWSLWWLETYLYPSTDLYQNTLERFQEWYLGLEGFYSPPPSSNHPCVNTVSYGRMGKITHWCCILTNIYYSHLIITNPSVHGKKGWDLDFTVL